MSLEVRTSENSYSLIAVPTISVLVHVRDKRLLSDWSSSLSVTSRLPMATGFCYFSGTAVDFGETLKTKFYFISSLKYFRNYTLVQHVKYDTKVRHFGPYSVPESDPILR